MLRAFTVAALLALALPALALAQEHRDEHKGPPPHPAGPPHPAVVPHPGGPPHPPGPPHPAMVPHPGGPPPGAMVHPGGPPPGAMMHPGGPPPGVRFSYHGRSFNPVHLNPFVYPSGWAYRRWAVGAVLPPLFLARDYWYADWAALGLDPPPPGYQWIRYGPDLLLVNVVTGQVAETVYGVFY